MQQNLYVAESWSIDFTFLLSIHQTHPRHCIYICVCTYVIKASKTLSNNMYDQRQTYIHVKAGYIFKKLVELWILLDASKGTMWGWYEFSFGEKGND